MTSFLNAVIDFGLSVVALALNAAALLIMTAAAFALLVVMFSTVPIRILANAYLSAAR